MTRELKDFIDNWQVNALAESAEHISGLKFRHISKGIDGQEKIEVSNLPQWARDFINKGNTIEQCEQMQAQLHEEFVDIYKQVIVPQQSIFYRSATTRTKS
jgi:hypothetical protein